MKFNCRRASRLLSDAQDRRLTLGERASLGFHLVQCSHCRNFQAHLHLLRRAARSDNIDG